MARKVKDITGLRSGKLTVTDMSHSDGREIYWKAVCDCGVVRTYRGGNLKQGKSKSCGCETHKWRKGSRHAVKDMTGEKFGRLTPVSFVDDDRRGAFWECVCDCGNSIVVSGKGLRSGDSKSCGCMQKDTVTTHGESGHELYGTWTDMIARCHDNTNSAYGRYGERGIVVCDEWRNSPRAFFNDMGKRPPGTSLDRMNGNGNYYKDNCRWATDSEQQNNRSNNTWYDYGGKPYNGKQLCSRLGLNYNATKARIHRGKTPSQAFGVDVKRISYEEAINLRME